MDIHIDDTQDGAVCIHVEDSKGSSLAVIEMPGKQLRHPGRPAGGRRGAAGVPVHA